MGCCWSKPEDEDIDIHSQNGDDERARLLPVATTTTREDHIAALLHQILVATTDLFIDISSIKKLETPPPSVTTKLAQYETVLAKADPKLKTLMESMRKAKMQNDNSLGVQGGSLSRSRTSQHDQALSHSSRSGLMPSSFSSSSHEYAMNEEGTREQLQRASDRIQVVYSGDVVIRGFGNTTNQQPSSY